MLEVFVLSVNVNSLQRQGIAEYVFANCFNVLTYIQVNEVFASVEGAVVYVLNGGRNMIFAVGVYCGVNDKSCQYLFILNLFIAE